MADIDVSATGLQAGDKAAVIRSGTIANVVLADGATKAVGTASTSLAAGNRGIPAGGATDQVLAKTSGTDYAVAWADAGVGGSGLPSGGASGQALVKTSATDYAVGWGSVIPSTGIGTTVQAWADVLDDLTAIPTADVMLGFNGASALTTYPAVVASGASSRFWTFDAAGVFKLATYAEAMAALLPSLPLAGKIIFQPTIYAPTSDVDTANDLWHLVIPSEMNGKKLLEITARLITAGSAGLLTMMLRNSTSAVDMLSTALTIDGTELSSSTAAAPAVVHSSNNTVATGDLLEFRVTGQTSSTKPKGLIATAKFGS